MIKEVLKHVETFKATTQFLKENSSYYPQLFLSEEGGELACSTLVRIERESIWYVVHCVERIKYPNKIADMEALLKKMMWSVYAIQTCYRITGKYEDVDTLQQSEVERLGEIFKH
jgi:hypothetical protein